MARILFVVAVCYCAICAHVAAVKETTLKQNHRLQTTVDSWQMSQPYKIETNAVPDSEVPIGDEQNVPKQLRERLKSAGDSESGHVDYQEFLSSDIVYGRSRRHAGGHGHAHDGASEDRELAAPFVRKLFEQFGNSDAGTMDVAGFEKMLKHLGLYRFIKDEETTTNEGNPMHKMPLSANKTCLSSVDFLTRVFSIGHDNSHAKNVHSHNGSAAPPVDHQSVNQPKIANQTNLDLLNAKAEGTSASNQTASTASTTTAINSIKQNLFLNQNDLWDICPILLYQLTAPNSLERSGCLDPASIPKHALHHHMLEIEGESRTWVWVYATLSIIGASLCGLLGVAVIPCMDRHYYQHVLQFFVALAIGTLAGDALLHLLPHAMMTFASAEDGHDSMTWRGLVATLGIIFFFLTERLLTMIAEWRKKKQKRDDPPGKVRVMRDPDSVSVNQSLNGEKQCKHKYSSYPYCYDEIALETKDDHHHHHHQPNASHGHSHGGKENGIKSLSTVSPKIKGRTPNRLDSEHSDTAQSLLPPPSNYTISGSGLGFIGNPDKVNDTQSSANHTVLTNLDGSSIDACGCEPKKDDENFTIILREHESTHHGHSHTHGHVHSPPKTLSAVAWMVIMGDGLHNFTDGMAIGAAFSNSIAGGFSTAIAVFCHELPHELGDFAVLLKAGMSARKAVYYNVLSSVLSLLGMIIGIWVGDTPEASAWIFSAAAGMFIYIALVDMMPELTTAHNESCAVTQCLLQTAGMFVGVGIMLIIALFESDLKIMFTPNDHHHIHHH